MNILKTKSTIHGSRSFYEVSLTQTRYCPIFFSMRSSDTHYTSVFHINTTMIRLMLVDQLSDNITVEGKIRHC